MDVFVYCFGQGLSVTCRPRANCDGCSQPRPAHPQSNILCECASPSMGRLLGWTGQGRRHADLDTFTWSRISKQLLSSPTRYRFGRLSRTVAVSDPRFQNQPVNISCNTYRFCRAFLVSFHTNWLVLSEIQPGSRRSARRWHLPTFSTALASTAAPLPHPLSDAAAFSRLFISLILSLSSPSLCLPPANGSHPLLLSSLSIQPVRAGPDLGPAGPDAGR